MIDLVLPLRAQSLAVGAVVEAGVDQLAQHRLCQEQRPLQPWHRLQ